MVGRAARTIAWRRGISGSLADAIDPAGRVPESEFVESAFT